MRKLAIIISIIMLMPNLYGCSTPREKTVYVYSWGDYIDPKVNDMFEKEYDCKVIYSTYDSNEAMYVKVKSNSEPCDVIFPSDYMVEKMIREGMLAKLNKQNIPNYANINPNLLGMEYDPQNDYTIPYFWGTVGILYNKKLVTDPVDSWGILWNEKYSRQIVMYNSQRDSIGLALKYLGFSMNSRDRNEVAQAEELLIKQKPLVLAYYTDYIQELMIGAEAALAVTYSGDAVYSISHNSDLGYVVPKEGSNKWFDSCAILQTSENKELAEKYIDYLCNDNISMMNTTAVMYSSANKNIESELRKTDWANNDTYFTPQDVMDRCEIFKDPADFIDVYSNVWENIISK